MYNNGMIIPSYQLSEHLNKLPSVITIVGQTMPLVHEAQDLIKQTMVDKNVLHLFYQEDDYLTLTQHLYAPSFDPQPYLFMLHLYENTCSDEWLQSIQHLLDSDQIHTLVVMLYTSPKTLPSWLKTLGKESLVLKIWPMSAKQRFYYCKRMLQKQGLSAQQDVINQLLQSCHHDDDILDGEIKKLASMSHEKPLDAEHIRQTISTYAPTNVFECLEQLFYGRATCLQQCRQVLLSAEDSKRLYYLIVSELRLLKQLISSDGEEKQALWSGFNSFQKARREYALSRLKADDLTRILQMVWPLEKTLKQFDHDFFCQQMQDFVYQIYLSLTST